MNHLRPRGRDQRRFGTHHPAGHQGSLCTPGLFLALFVVSSSVFAQSGIGPFGGEIRALAAHPTDGRLVYAATALGGVFKTVDRGASWNRLGLELGVSSPEGLAIDPADPKRLYIAVQRNPGVYRSEDAGRTWLPPNSPPGDAVVGVFLDPADSFVLYAPGSLGSVFKSQDRGVTWFPSGSGLPEFEVISAIAVDPLVSRRIYAGFRNGKVFRSADGGASWMESDAGLPRGALSDLKAVSGQSRSLLLAATHAGLFRSADNAVTWSLAGSGLPPAQPVSIAFDPRSGVISVGTERAGVFRSPDGGTTWTAANRGIESEWVTSLVAGPAGSGFLFAGTKSDGVFHTGDGGENWAESNQGLSSRDVRAIVIHPLDSSRLYVATWGDGVFYSADRGRTWCSRNQGLENLFVGVLVIDPRSPEVLYAGTPAFLGAGGVFKTSDGGLTWSLSNPRPPPPDSEGPSLSVVSLAVDPVSSGTLYVSTNGLGTYKSIDGAASWAKVIDRLGYLLIDPRNPTTVYLASGSVLSKSLDGGRTWSLTFLEFPDYEIHLLAIDPADTKILYGTRCGVAINTGEPALFKSTDGGASWRLSVDGLTASCVMAVLVHPLDPRIIYAGTQHRADLSGGIFRSLDGATTWSVSSDQLVNPLIWCLAADPQNLRIIYAGTYGNGVSVSLDGGATWNAGRSSRPQPIRSGSRARVARPVPFRK